jgi:hypothetical protein
MSTLLETRTWNNSVVNDTLSETTKQQPPLLEKMTKYCQGTNEHGAPCGNQARPGRKTCSHHPGAKASRAINMKHTHKLCKARLQSGDRCTYHVAPGNTGYCKVHE